MDTNDREYFYFRCWLRLKGKEPFLNGQMRDIELEMANFDNTPLEKPIEKEAGVKMPDDAIIKDGTVL
jgi:hypothetical protein